MCLFHALSTIIRWIKLATDCSKAVILVEFLYFISENSSVVYFVLSILLVAIVIIMALPLLGKRELIFLLEVSSYSLYPGFKAASFEPRFEKTGFLHLRKQRRRSASR